MKTRIVILTTCLFVFSFFITDAQTHHINIHFGGAWNNNIYKRIPAFRENYSLSAIFDFQYAYFFNEHWGLGLGVTLSDIHAKSTMDFDKVIEYFPGNEINNDQTYYDIYFVGKSVVEKQNVLALEIPLQAQFEWRFNKVAGIYAALGAKTYLPLRARNFGNGTGTLTTSGYEEYTDSYYHDMDNHFDTETYIKQSGPEIGIASKYNPSGVGAKEARKYRMRASINLAADFGFVFKMGSNVDFYIGTYYSVGLLDILPKYKTSFFTNEGITGTLGSDVLTQFNVKRDKWHMITCGLKMGLHIKHKN